MVVRRKMEGHLGARGEEDMRKVWPTGEQERLANRVRGGGGDARVCSAAPSFSPK